VDAHNQYFFVVGPIENADPAVPEALVRSPEIVMVQFFSAGRLKEKTEHPCDSRRT